MLLSFQETSERFPGGRISAAHLFLLVLGSDRKGYGQQYW